MTTFTLYGGKELAENLNGLSKATRKKHLYAILKPAAEPIRERAGAIVHRRAPAPDIADNMVVSIVQKTPDGRVDEFQAAVAVGPAKGFSHGKFLEYGTIHARAFQFLRPAFDGGVARAFGIIQEGIWALLRKANKAPSTSQFGSGGTL
jgi:HK97 gp10 family phage protein